MGDETGGLAERPENDEIEADADGDEHSPIRLPITRLLFERRRIVYESGEVDVEEWDGEDWVAVEDE